MIGGITLKVWEEKIMISQGKPIMVYRMKNSKGYILDVISLGAPCLPLKCLTEMVRSKMLFSRFLGSFA